MNDFKNSIINLFRKFKLGSSLFSQEYYLSKEEKDIIELNFDINSEDFIRNKAIQNLSNFIINQHKSSFIEIDKEKYRIELLVLKLSDFKTIVEAAIQLIPQEEIDKIKSGETIL